MHPLTVYLASLIVRAVKKALAEAVDLCRQSGALPSEEWDAWLALQSEYIAQNAVRTVIRGSSQTAIQFARTAPDENLWLAAERDERDHRLTIHDFRTAGFLEPPVELRGDGAPEAATIVAANPRAADPLPIDVVFRRQAYDWLVRAEKEAIRSSFPESWANTSDARFWRYRDDHNAWAPLDFEDPSSVAALCALVQAAPPPKERRLQGYYCGYPISAVFYVDAPRGEIGVRCPWRGTPWVCADLGEVHGLAESARSAREYVLRTRTPHLAWRYWTAEPPADLDGLRDRFWQALQAAENREAFWGAHSCHWAGSPPRRLDLQRFLFRSVVRGYPKTRTHDFVRGLMFPLVALPDGRSLDRGEVLVRGPEPDLVATGGLRIFAEGDYVPDNRFRRCGRCGHHWHGARAGDPCPRSCGGAAGRLPVTVYVPRREERL